MSTIVEILITELERPRELSARVLNYIGGTYGIDHDAVGAFLVEELPKLEDDDIDLILSPVFTPKLSDQVVVAESLGTKSIPRDKLQELVQQIAARRAVAQLVTPDGRAHSVPLREVTIERYVQRLRLEGSISESVSGLIEQAGSEADRPMLKAIARRAIWEAAGAQQILVHYLTVVQARGSYNLSGVLDLLQLMESRKPVNIQDLRARIPGWREALRQQIEVAFGGKPFFHEDIRLMHGGGRDQRPQEDVRMSAKERELDFLIHLEQILAE